MCTEPIKIKIPYKDMSIESCQKRAKKGIPIDKFYGYVPCGKCYDCLSLRRNQWTFRLQREAENSKNTYFVTLTYDDEYCDNSVHKDTLVKVTKYLRDKCQLDFTYYGIGEYGTTTFRPHYHLMLFFKDEYEQNTVIQCINKSWSTKTNVNGKYTYEPIGFTQIAVANIARMHYITHYHVRPKDPPTIHPNSEKPFTIMSKGLGNQWFENENILNYIEQSPDYDIHDYNGNSYLLPRYYRKKHGIDKDILATPKHYIIKSREEYEYYLSLNTNEQIRYLNSKKQASKRKLNNYHKQIKQNTI